MSKIVPYIFITPLSTSTLIEYDASYAISYIIETIIKITKINKSYKPIMEFYNHKQFKINSVKCLELMCKKTLKVEILLRCLNGFACKLFYFISMVTKVLRND